MRILTCFKITPVLITGAAMMLSGGCINKLTESIQTGTIPAGLHNTTLLVQKYEYRDPTMYDPFFVSDSDSIKTLSGFTYQAGELSGETDSAEKDHPLIIKTNQHLDEYNSQLEKVFKDYAYKSELVELSTLDSTRKYSNKDKFRYVLMHKPVLHCYIDPTGETFLSYRYLHYFHDRKTASNYPEIELFSPYPWMTAKAIVEKIEESESE